MAWRRAFYLFSILLFLALPACSSTPAPTAAVLPTVTLAPTATPAPQPTATIGSVPQAAAEPQVSGQIRVVQAAPETGAVDVYLEQALIAGRLGPGAFTNPVAVPVGVYTLQVIPAGAQIDTQVLAETSVNILPEQSFLALITGTAETLNISVFQEDLSAIPQGQSRLAFLHGVPRGPLFSPRVDAQPLPDILDLGQVSAGYLFESRPHRLAFYAGDTLLASIDAALAPQQMYTAVLIGRVGGGDYRILLFSTPVQTPGQVRFIHAAPSTGYVRIDLGEQTLAENLPYRDTGGWQPVKPGTYELRVTEADAEEATRPLVVTRLNIAPAQALEIVMLEERGIPTVRAYDYPLAPTLPQTIRLVSVNAAPDAPVIYAQMFSERLASIPPIPYGAYTRPLDLPAGQYDELMWLTGEGNNARVVERAGSVTLEEGHTYTYIVTGQDYLPFLLGTETGLDTSVASIGPDTNPGDVAEVRALNALAEPLGLRVQLGDITLTELLEYAEASGYQTVPAQDYTLRVGSAGSSYNAPDYLIQDLPLLNTRKATILLYGPAETMQAALLPDYEDPVGLGQAVLRVIHAAPGRGDLTISLNIPGIMPTQPPIDIDGTPSYPPPTPDRSLDTYKSSAFRPGDSTGFVGLPTGVYDILVQRTSDSHVVAIVPRLQLESRTLYDLILLPDTSGEGFTVQLLSQNVESRP